MTTQEDIDRIANTEIHITPAGILAATFGDLVKSMETSEWWRTSPLLAGIGFAYYLQERGYTITRIEDEQ